MESKGREKLKEKEAGTKNIIHRTQGEKTKKKKKQQISAKVETKDIIDRTKGEQENK